MTEDQWRRAAPVLTEALGLGAVERERLLKSAFARESALSGALMSALHEYDAAARRLASDRNPDAFFLVPGDMCGRYRVVRPLGAGGMGEVYLAEDIDLGTPVALKLVSNVSLDSPEARARFRREAARTAQLRYHANIATVLQFMELELKGRSAAVLAMEYVTGSPASDVIAEGPVGVERAVRWAIQIARAIEFAHERGIVHCDLKPANVLIDQSGPDEHVKVVDFGIARALFDDSGNDPLAGTPAYMAPEQVTANRCSPASDIYALGATLFELVTGRQPYEIPDTEQLLLHLIAAPVPCASNIAAGIPKRLDGALQRAMAKRPEQRYASMALFRTELEHLLPRRRATHLWFVAACAASVVAFVTVLGFVASQALDQGLSRSTSIGATALFGWLYWGGRSLVAPTVFSVTLLLLFVCVASIMRLAWSIPPFRALCAPIARPLQSSVARLTSLPARTLAEVLLVTHVAILGATAAYFRSLLTSFMNFMMAAPGSIAALRPSNLATHEMYGYTVTLELLVFSLAWYRWLRLRSTRRESDGLLHIAAGMAAIAVSLFLFTARFRILSHNELERVVHGSETCYLVEERGEAALLFCPLTYPRNVRVNRQEIVPTGKIESIFSALDAP